MNYRMVSAAPPLVGIFGSGRSGSTWLGSIVNSHPDVAYRFEPFHRLGQHPRIAKARHILDSKDLDDKNLDLVYEALLPANPLLDKPPFFPKSSATEFARAFVWNFARTTPVLHDTFERIYSPKNRPLVAFKEVMMEPVMHNILERTSMHVAYLVRHPAAVAASQLRGQKAKVMTSGGDEKVLTLLRSLSPELAKEYEPRLSTMSDLEKNALLWRAEVEYGLAAMRDHPSAKLVIYEALCTQPKAVTQGLFDHFGLELHPQTERFIDQSTNADQAARWSSGEAVIDDYFSVFRNALESMNKWQRDLSDEEKRQIRDIVEGSPAYQQCREMGYWQ